jgi:hypothetical protein
VGDVGGEVGRAGAMPGGWWLLFSENDQPSKPPAIG